MAPAQRGKEQKTKSATREAVKRPTSKHDRQKQLERKEKALERASQGYDKASPEMKKRIDDQRNDVAALRAAIEQADAATEEMDVEEPATPLGGDEGKIDNGGAAPDVQSTEKGHVNENDTAPTGSTPDNDSTSPGKDDDSSKVPGNPGGDGKNEPEHGNRAANEEGQQQKPDTVIPSIEEDGSNGSLFTRDDENPESEDSGHDSGHEDPEYGKPLLTIPATSGITEDGVMTVGWSGRVLRKYINMYGTKYSATYRVENRAFPPSYAENPPEHENVGSANNRYGDTLPGIGRVQHPNAEISRIWGVAWRGLNSGDLEHDLELIDPEYNESFTHTVTYILVGWLIDGKEEKKWETRTAYRNIIGNRSKADKYIYKAAVESQHRYIMAKGGEREASRRSPSVPLLEAEVGPARGKARSAKRTGGSSWRKRRSAQSDRGSSPTLFLPSPRSTVSPQRQTQGAGELRAKFLADWLELRGAVNFQELDAGEQQQCVESWQVYKAKNLTSAA